MSAATCPIVRPTRLPHVVLCAALAGISTAIVIVAFAIGFCAGYFAAHIEYTNPSAPWLPWKEFS